MDTPQYKYSDLKPVARTLLATVAYRAVESRRPDAILSDPRALELASKFEDDFLKIAERSNMDQIFTMMRARQFDQYARQFMEKYPHCGVVDLGCGLDTRFERIDNGQMRWYGIDFPEVIEIRRQLLPEESRCHLMACSILELDWIEQIAARPLIFLAEGVFPYLTEDEVRKLVLSIAERLPGSGLVFDMLTPFSIWLHSRNPVLRTAQVKLHWGIDDSRVLESWGTGVRFLDEWGYFDQKEPRLGIYYCLRFVPPLANANRVLHYMLGSLN